LSETQIVYVKPKGRADVKSFSEEKKKEDQAANCWRESTWTEEGTST